ncbi:MAG: PAC2 family protein [Nanoarchaeota archaeon]|nr:PAC2 family protein [Nanoarchaeota archaeon]
MEEWILDEITSVPQLRNPILIEGLPGIGNVGKVAVDFIIDELKAKKIFEITSCSFPNAVFVNEENLVDLPKIEIYHKKIKDRDILFLAGDVQPIDERSSYTFSEKILEISSKHNIKRIITLGGIGLAHIPKEPKVYCTGNDKDMIEAYKQEGLSEELYGVVGPIIGVTGLLLGLAAKKEIKAIALLAETYSNPMYLGVKASKKIISILNKKLELNIDPDKLEKEIKQIESEVLRRSDEFKKVSEIGSHSGKAGAEVTYIG